MSGARDGVNILNEVIQESDKVQGYKFFIKFIFDCAFALVMPILRRNFGERFFSLPMIIVMGGGVLFAGFFFGLNDIQIYSYMAVIGVLSLFHMLIIIFRNKRGEEWHTRYEGDYLPFFRFLPKAKNEWVIEGFYEPLFVALCALGFANFNMPLFANFLLIIAALMIIRARFNYSLHKAKLLDDRDAMIEAEYAIQAINGSSSKDSKGFIIKGAKTLDIRDKTAMGKRKLSNEDFKKTFSDIQDINITKDEMRAAT